MSINTVGTYNQYGYYSGANGINQQKVQNFTGNSGNNVNQSIFNTPPSSACADGKDDGSIGIGSALGGLLKGGIKLFTGMFTDQNGNFSLGQTFNSLLTVGLIGAATFIPVIGPFVVPALCTYGMIDGGLGVLDALDKASSAKTDAEAEAALESMGAHATEGVLSYLGYKASGGFSAAKEAASADWIDFKNKWNSSSSSSANPKPAGPAPESNTGSAITPYESQVAESSTASDYIALDVKGKTVEGGFIDAKAQEIPINSGRMASETLNSGTQNPNGASATIRNIRFSQNDIDLIKQLSNKSNLSFADMQEFGRIVGLDGEQVLNLSRTDYLRLAKKYHPDLNPTQAEVATPILQILNKCMKMSKFKMAA